MAEGLSDAMTVARGEPNAAHGRQVTVSERLTNCATAKWLAQIFEV